MITSGSWRRKLRSAAAKVMPRLTFICTWLMPGTRISTGSSTVEMLRCFVVEDVQRGVQRHRLARAGRAGDQHHAVGLAAPRRRTASSGRPRSRACRCPAWRRCRRGYAARPSRRTASGRVLTRKSICLVLDRLSLMRPSCGTRFSAMSSCAMTFRRAAMRALQLHRHLGDLLEQAVDAQAHAVFGFVGLEVDVRGAAADRVDQHLVDELDDRRVVALGVDAGVVGQVVVAAGGCRGSRGPRRRPSASARASAVCQPLVDACGGSGPRRPGSARPSGWSGT